MQQNNNFNDEIDIREIISVLWRGKYFLVIFTIISLAFGSYYLRNATKYYQVSVILVPALDEQPSPNLGRLGGLASLAGVALPTGKSSDFDKYKIMLKTKEISALIFQDKKLIQDLFSGEWDKTEQIFREPAKTKKTLVKNYLKLVLTGENPEKYVEPDPSRLRKKISDSIKVDSGQYLTISTITPNPELWTRLIVSLISNTDKLFKKNFIMDADEAVGFYQIKISKARSQEHRQILATLLAKEERKLLLASRNGPFVAEILTGPNTSLNPVSPKVTNTLLLSILVGGVLSSGSLLLRHFLTRTSK